MDEQRYTDHRGDLTFVSNPFTEKCFNWKNIVISSNTSKHTFRGMHYQKPNTELCKYVHVVKGAIVDFMENVHNGQTEVVNLKAGQSVYVPTYMLHGFLTLVPSTIVLYATTQDYVQKNQVIKHWSTNKIIKEIILKETGGKLVISDKDKFIK